jgi:hypothetical protein
MYRRTWALRILLIGLPLAALAWPGAAWSQSPREVDGDTLVETIFLQFDWPGGMTADVEAFRSMVKWSSQGSDSSRVDLSYRVRVEDQLGDRVLRHDSVTVPALEFAGLSGSREAGLVDQLATLTPSYVVSGDGMFQGLEDVEALRSLVAGIVDEVTGKRLDELPAGAQELIRSLTSDEMLATNAAQQWNALVGFWVGADLEVGALYELESDEPIPLLGGFVVPTTHRFQLVGRVPCDAETANVECVELQMVSIPDSESFQEILQATAGRLAADQDAVPTFRAVQIETAVTLITEPATLAPHSLEIVKTFSATVDEQGASLDVGQVETRSYSYRYRI